MRQWLATHTHWNMLLIGLLHNKRWDGTWNNDYYCNGDELVESYDDYQKRKAQKAQIKKELIRIAWLPSR